ncbi:MAG: hypothetical protein ABIW46_06180 [Acidimicrobiales bacterium]
MVRVRPAGSATREEGRGLIVVLDTGGVEGVAPIDERRRARLRVVRDQASEVVVPAAVLAEGVLTGHAGHDYHVRRLLGLVRVADVDEYLGHMAGALRQAAIRAGFDPPPSGVDAVVAAEADALAGSDVVEIITGDGHDFELLASLAHHAGRLSVVVV